MWYNLAYLSQGACLIRADYRDGTKSLDSLKRLAKNLLLAHDICRDCQTSRDSNRQSLGNEGNGYRNAVDDQSRDVDPLRVDLSQPSPPTILSASCAREESWEV